MKKEKIIMNNEDITKTKDLIIDCAGQLIAKYGYPKVTSKSICEKAGINLAAINYHFGSRDGLYVEVLKEVHKFLINVDELKNLYMKDLSPKEKLETFIDLFIKSSLDEKNWHIKVWAREIVNPSPYINQILSEEIMPKLNIVARIFGEYTEMSLEDPKLYSCILNTMSPFIIVFLVHNTPEVVPIKDSVKPSVEELISHLKRFAFAGLDEFKKKEM